MLEVGYAGDCVDRNIFSSLERRLTAEASEIIVFANGKACVDRVPLRGEPSDFSESEMFPEFLCELACRVSQLVDERNRRSQRITSEANVRGLVAEIELIGSKIESLSRTIGPPMLPPACRRE